MCIRDRAGTLSAAVITHYLANVHFLIGHTPVYLARARERARALGDLPLADHFQHKIEEEVGHDVWAERDLESMTRLTVQPADLAVAPSMKSLIDYLARTIDEDPCLYLSYIAFAEYLIVILGPQWLALLEEKCGIPTTSMSVIANHAELDRAHAEEAFARIDDLVANPRKLGRMRQVLLDSFTHFDAFCVEVTSRGTQQAHRREANVSAA